MIRLVFHQSSYKCPDALDGLYPTTYPPLRRHETQVGNVFLLVLQATSFILNPICFTNFGGIRAFACCVVMLYWFEPFSSSSHVSAYFR